MTFRDALILLCLGALAGGCAVADTGSFVRLQEDMESLKKEVATLKAAGAFAAPAGPAAPATARAGSDELGAMQRNVADLMVNYDQMKSDVIAATTRADEARLQVQKETAQQNEKISEAGQAVQEMKGKMGRIDEIDRRLAALEEKGGKTGGTAVGTVPVAPAAPPAAPQTWKSPEEMYDYALGVIKSGDPRKAREVLTAFASKYPGHKLLPNVYYWKGETFYVEKDYENAILSFQDVIDKYPSADKAPDAMLKQGLSFMALKDQKNARILFELLQSKYPKTSAASLARQKLNEMR